MESNLPNQSPDKTETKPSFRKPSNDASNRRYRRHSSVGGGGSDSSSAGDSPKRGQNRGRIYSREDRANVDDRRRKDDGRELDRENHNRSGRTSNSYITSDWHTHMSSHGYRRHDVHTRDHRDADGDDRIYQRLSRSGRDSRGGNRFDHTTQDSNSERFQDTRRNIGNHSRDKFDSEYRSNDKERDIFSNERYKYNYNDSAPDRAPVVSRQVNSDKNETKTVERDWHRDRGTREDRRDRHRSPGYHKNDNASSNEGIRGHGKEISTTRDSSSRHLKESHRTGDKELDAKEDTLNKRKCDKGSELHRDRYSQEPEEEIQNKRSSSFHQDRYARSDGDRSIHLNEDQNTSRKKSKSDYSVDEQPPFKLKAVAEDEKPEPSSKQVKETASKFSSEPVSSFSSHAETASDLGAATVAAMKAAELVNRNLAGGGYLSTDQKKKLLWGNKKNTAAEESGNRWGLPLFSDRERQEKFNKLMGVKGDLKLEHGADDKDGTLQAEKQEQLQMDLEKQYTAGLRRRDGRTVGLGL